MELITNDFKIEFIKIIKTNGHFLYKIELTCINNTSINMSDFVLNAGINYLKLNKIRYKNIELLNKFEMKKNEVKEGYICFQKGNMATNQPKFFYKNKFIQLRNIKMVGGDFV